MTMTYIMTHVPSMYLLSIDLELFSQQRHLFQHYILSSIPKMKVINMSYNSMRESIKFMRLNEL